MKRVSYNESLLYVYTFLFHLLSFALELPPPADYHLPVSDARRTLSLAPSAQSFSGNLLFVYIHDFSV